MRTAHSRNCLFRALLLLTATLVPHNSLFALSPPPVHSDDPSALTYRSTVSEVRLLFFARDEQNRPVQELRQDDFAIVDDENVIRHFRSFNRASSVKLDVTFLIDSSESVLPQFQHEIQSILDLMAQWPWNPDDSVSALSFGGMRAYSICTLNCRTTLTANRMAAIPLGGSTPLFDALDAAATSLRQRQQPEVWPLVILFSDGHDTISIASLQTALKNVLASGAPIYFIDVGSRSAVPGPAAQELAEDSGGRCISLSEGPAKILYDVFDDLRTARVVTYGLPPSKSGFHSVRILPTHNLKLQFRSRRGYYDESNTAH